ncbi:TolC family protein [Croceiramulus getboli]|nr:TolC family protein [Flavobacteriaceae bacterium YJPT1-3]
MSRFSPKILITLTALLMSMVVAGQQAPEIRSVLTFEEYLGYVKRYHPLIKQAELALSVGEANLLRARGGFDPKFEVDYDRKKFKGTEYYDQFNATFKIPTWYGVELKANFEENTGEFLNPDLTVPDGGLYSAGVSLSLAQGLLINERMASLKQAKYFLEQSQADRELLVNQLIFEASLAYFSWLEAVNERLIYSNFQENASVRLAAVKRSIEEGDKAAIDSTEAGITVQNRRLELEMATLKAQKARLAMSTYLWLDDVPLEVQEGVFPTRPEREVLVSSLGAVNVLNIEELLAASPKLRSLEAKLEGLRVDRRFKRNKLLPVIDVQYNFLSTEYDQLSTFNTANYKAFVNASIPIFLRKERGELKLADYKVQDTEFEQLSTALTLENKIEAVKAEIQSLQTQNEYIENIVRDYQTMVDAEERRFFLGESSLFLINSREQSLIDAQLKANKLLVELLTSRAKWYNTLGFSLVSVEEQD